LNHTISSVIPECFFRESQRYFTEVPEKCIRE
jgi:hypothetical protein